MAPNKIGGLKQGPILPPFYRLFVSRLFLALRVKRTSVFQRCQSEERPERPCGPAVGLI